MYKTSDRDLTQGRVWKRILMFALPIFLGTLFQSFYSMADAIIVGRFAGKEALAAIESVWTLTRFPMNFATGLASGATIIISHFYGAKKSKEVSDGSHTAMVISALVGIIIIGLGLISSSFLIDLVQVPSEIRSQALAYLRIYFCGMLGFMVYNMGAGVLRAVGDSKTPFYCLLAANLLNIGLDLVLVAVLKKGVRGAALATIISQAFSAVLVLVSLMKSDQACKIMLGSLRIHPNYLKSIFRLGLPVALQSILYPIANTIVQTSINTFGVNEIAAWAICGKLDFLVWTMSESFGTASSTFVAQNLGAGKGDRVRQGVRAGLLMAIGSVMLVSAILLIWARPLAGLLVRDGEVIDLTVKIIWLIGPLYFTYTFSEVLPGAIRGMGDTIRPMIITLICTCLLRVAWVLLILPLRPDFLFLLLAYPVSWIVNGLAFIILYFYKIKNLEFIES